MHSENKVRARLQMIDERLARNARCRGASAMQVSSLASRIGSTKAPNGIIPIKTSVLLTKKSRTDGLNPSWYFEKPIPSALPTKKWELSWNTNRSETITVPSMYAHIRLAKNAISSLI